MPGRGTRGWAVTLWWPERMLRVGYPAVAVAVAVLVLINELLIGGWHPQRWDWLLVTGAATLLVALRRALYLPDRLDEALTRLANRGMLTKRDLPEFCRESHRRARRAALIGAAIFAVAVGVAWTVAFGAEIGDRIILAVGETVAAVPVGMFVGRASSYGRLGTRLRRARFELTPDPRHLDGAAGMLPIGNFYFHQAGLLAVPGVFLAVWWFLIPLFGQRYLVWRTPYAGLLAVVVISEILVFVLPMLSFHQVMLARKVDLFREADELTGRSARAVGGEPLSEGDRQRYQDIESMPVWPVDVRIRRRFGINNALLLVPVVAQLLGASEATQKLLENIQNFLAGSA
ncbi:MAG TPA: hypothetical protein VHV49_05280 [Pseudonocardiaceae bacterium]|jgi:hypothetical protein|nr:hypothetical protein [Pseudonocardiaceae bacterium]